MLALKAKKRKDRYINYENKSKKEHCGTEERKHNY